MQFGVGTIRLSDIAGGTLGAGVVPIPRLLRFTAQAENAGAISLINGTVSAVSINCGAVTAGDVILAIATYVVGIAPAISVTTFWGKTAGTATVGLPNNNTVAGETYLNSDILNARHSIPTLGSVTGTGTLTIDFQLNAGGIVGNYISAGVCDCGVWIFAGS